MILQYITIDMSLNISMIIPCREVSIWPVMLRYWTCIFTVPVVIIGSVDEFKIFTYILVWWPINTMKRELSPNRDREERGWETWRNSQEFPLSWIHCTIVWKVKEICRYLHTAYHTHTLYACVPHTHTHTHTIFYTNRTHIQLSLLMG